MNYRSKILRRVLSVSRIAVTAWLVFGAPLVYAQSASSSGVNLVRAFYAVLLGTMKQGAALGASGRYARLEPVIRRTFDVPFMIRVVVGTDWASLSADRRQEASKAFERFLSATYAERFENYSGEKLEVEGARALGSDILVATRIVKSNGASVDINYLMRRSGGQWRVADVYLGTISQLAAHRSEFSSILRDEGIDGLIADFNRQADLLSTIPAKSG